MDELSMLSPGAADTAARAARSTGTAFAEAAGHTAGARIGSWSGSAQLGFAARADALHDRLTLLADVAAAGAGIVEEFSRELGVLQARLRTVDADLAEAQRRTLDTTLTVADFQSTWAAVDRWQRTRQQVLDAYDDATDRLAQRLTAILDHVPHRPRSLGEHLADAGDAVGESVEGSLWIGLGWLDDPGGWWRDVRGLPAALQSQATHPVDTVRDALHVDDLEDGRYGTAAGALGAAAVGRGLGRAVERVTPDGVPGHERNGPGRAPGLVPQSLDEMLVGVDLSRSEGVEGGHTIERHVDVDDDYLRARLFKGTPNPATGQLGRPLGEASRWTDLSTAQSVITRVLGENRSRLVELPVGGTVALYAAVPPSSGTLLVKVNGEAVERPASRAKIVVGRTAAGEYYVRTAYLDGGRT
ncbi:RNase A-like domain-containing protein [Kineococcus rubinsiae]|uniref:RNase A-like domain-containing protein n=1 Tax=Kineococcus rubinsiae TaxID=2609562 RepID=UPI0014300485|nr:RNase A-like domain-containing protein [Kineococcus rubinsiae]NIZ90059.1 hypothetical protein [Kineococcus rubinsiae]